MQWLSVGVERVLGALERGGGRKERKEKGGGEGRKGGEGERRGIKGERRNREKEKGDQSRRGEAGEETHCRMQQPPLSVFTLLNLVNLPLDLWHLCIFDHLSTISMTPCQHSVSVSRFYRLRRQRFQIHTLGRDSH